MLETGLINLLALWGGGCLLVLLAMEIVNRYIKRHRQATLLSEFLELLEENRGPGKADPAE